MTAISPKTIKLPSFSLKKNDSIISEGNHNLIFAYVVLHIVHGRYSDLLQASSSGYPISSTANFSDLSREAIRHQPLFQLVRGLFAGRAEAWADHAQLFRAGVGYI
jgi:hypothetical protein